MRDQIALVLVSVAFALIAAALWKYFGRDALNLLLLLSLVACVADNVRLRRQMRTLLAK
jgi:hypothetical protein